MSWLDERSGEREEYDAWSRMADRDRLEEEIERLSQKAADLRMANNHAAGLLRSALGQTVPSDDKIIVEYMQGALVALEGVK